MRGESQDSGLFAAFGVFNRYRRWLPGRGRLTVLHGRLIRRESEEGTAQMMLDQGCSEFHAWRTIL